VNGDSQGEHASGFRFGGPAKSHLRALRFTKTFGFHSRVDSGGSKMRNEEVALNTVTTEPGVPKWKPVLDYFCIVLALPVVLPLMLIIAIAIKLVSRGPVLFRQERIGYLGKPFTCWKFRTMKIDSRSTAHESYLRNLIRSSQPMTKKDLKGDPRVIPVLGRFLRATGLDELPQLFNVLRGEMSIVGPRPCISCEYEEYLTWHRERFNTLPGLTGLWQVSGKNRTTFDEMVCLDICYVQNLSLGMDLEIMLKTLPALAEQVLEILANRWPVFHALIHWRTAGRVTEKPIEIANTPYRELITCRRKKCQNRLALE
jgi:lipopolysaccharide/colanic/teichoic acid biosynthesis glycosyltransferase